MQSRTTNNGNLEESKVSSDTIIALWEDLYTKKQQAWLTILSGSMMPLLQVGDKVLVHAVKPTDIRFGDIIVFKNPDKLIVHRVIGKADSSTYLQKGDNATTAEIVSSADVLGKAIAIQKGKRIIQLNNRKWKFINLALTLFSCSVYHLKPQNPALKQIARLFYDKAKVIFDHIITKI
jgi:signal peptidase I